MVVLSLAVLVERAAQRVLETVARLLELAALEPLFPPLMALLAVPVAYGLRLPKGDSMDAFIYVAIGVVTVVFAVYVLNTNRRKPNPKPNGSPIPSPDPATVEAALAAHKASVDAVLGKSSTGSKPSNPLVSPAPDLAAIQAAVEANRDATYPVSSAPTPAADPVVAVVPRRKKAAGTPKTGKKV
jgi:hypothetical protein